MYESKVFRNKIPLGRIAFPLFCIKNKEYTMWIDIEEENEVICPKVKKGDTTVEIVNSTARKKRLRQDSRSPSPNNKKQQGKKKEIYIDDEIIDFDYNPSRKQVLVHFSLTPVTYTIQDFQMIASLSRGILDRKQVESLFVRDKDSSNCYFMKILPTDDDDESIFLKKDISYSYIPTWGLPSHPFLVDIVTSFQVSQKLFIVTEWISGGELFSELRRTVDGRFDEETARFYASQILLCIKHFHQNKICYRDLKPENILLANDGYCKITPKLSDRYTKSLTSLPEHMAPEVLLGYNVTNKSDWWTFGTIMYQMLVGQPPFTHHNVQTMLNRILEDDIFLPSYLSESACTLLKGVLNRDIRKRYGYKQIRNSDFFINVDWQKLIRKELDPPLRPYRNKHINFPNTKPSHGKVRESPPPSKRKLL